MTLELIQTWDKTFSQSDKVIHEKVTFKNRYGITLAGDLYRPKNTTEESLPALAITGPFGAVKEQSSGLYAQTMAERGYITLAFDPSYTGESGGTPRNMASPEINTEDVSAAVDFLGLLKGVDRNRIGLIGICGYGGMGLNAAAADTRIKAIVTTSMYDISRLFASGYNDSTTKEQRSEALEGLSQQRWKDAESGTPSYGPSVLPAALTGEEPPFVAEYFDYYKTPRGFHPNSINSHQTWTATMPISFYNMPLMSYIDEISPRPILLIAGDNAHSRFFSEYAYAAAAEPKELMIIEDTVHVDLYDNVEKIPFNRINEFFTESLK